MHCCLCTGYYLYDNGYDVWMGNARGNRYSRNHTSLNPNSDGQFWNFSWHEIGMYDLPAMINYVLEETNFEKLGYFGHSQVIKDRSSQLLNCLPRTHQRILLFLNMLRVQPLSG